jgi:hypothetical protein
LIAIFYQDRLGTSKVLGKLRKTRAVSAQLMPFLLGAHGSMMLGEKEEDAEKFSSTSKPVLLMQADQCGLLHAPVRNPPDLPWSDAEFSQRKPIICQDRLGTNTRTAPKTGPVQAAPARAVLAEHGSGSLCVAVHAEKTAGAKNWKKTPVLAPFPLRKTIIICQYRL